MGLPQGRANFSSVPVGGGVGGMKAPLNGRTASAITVHGGNATGGGAAGRSRLRLVREQPQRPPALRAGRGVWCGSAKGMMPGRGDIAPSGAMSA
jgi:hypothetical protein